MLVYISVSVLNHDLLTLEMKSNLDTILLKCWPRSKLLMVRLYRRSTMKWMKRELLIKHIEISPAQLYNCPTPSDSRCKQRRGFIVVIMTIMPCLQSRTTRQRLLSCCVEPVTRDAVPHPYPSLGMRPKTGSHYSTQGTKLPPPKGRDVVLESRTWTRVRLESRFRT